jgi:hypothetical protein
MKAMDKVVKVAMVMVAVVGLGLLPEREAAAGTWYTQEFSYPGTQCNSYGSTAMGPNGAAELVNWSSSSAVLVDCPVLYDSRSGDIDNVAYLDMRGANVTCQLFHMQPDGTGWAWHNDGTTNHSGYVELYWNGHSGYPVLGSTAIECLVPQWGTISNYRVNATYLQNP